MNYKNTKYIPYGRQSINEDDIAAVCSVLRSDWLTQGPTVKKFEDEIAQKVESKYAVACSNGTAALHLACLAAGFGKGDTVLTSPMTFLASANCARYVGADIDFIDINPKTLCIDPELIADYLADNKEKEGLKGIIPVHFAGVPCNMPLIYKLAKKAGMVIIEDACHALGAYYKFNNENIPVGSCRHSDMAVFSFHPVKHITTGEGGVITTNNKDLYEKLLLFRSHGITKDPEGFVNEDLAFEGLSFSNPQSKIQNPKSPNPWYYEMHELGFNYRITDMQCALGILQLERLDSFIQIRKDIAGKYITAFKNNDNINLVQPEENLFPSWHLFPIQFNLRKLKLSRREIVDEYHKNGIGVQIHYIPLYHQPYYKNLYEFDSKQYQNSEKYYKSCVSLPLFPGLSDNDIDRIIDITFQIINKGKLC